MPSTCTNKDVQESLNEYLKEFTSGTAIEYKIRVEEKMCQIKEKNYKAQPYTKLAT